MRTPAAPTVSAAATAKATIPANFTSRSRVRPTGTTSRLRRVPIDASPATASPEATETASGRNSGSVTTSAVKATNSPFPVIWPMNAGPSPSPSPPRRGPPLPALRRIATAISTGTQAGATSGAGLRRRPKTSRSSERSSRVERPRGARATGRAVPPRAAPGASTCEASLVDIEALPRQRDEHVLEVGPLDRDLTHAHTREHQLPGDQLRRRVPDRRVESLGLHRRHRQAQPRQAPARHRDVGRTGDDDPQPGRGHVPQLREGALGDEPAAAHDGDVRADLLDLGQQVRGDEDRAALRGELPDQGPYLPGALRVEAVRRLVQH